MDIIEFQQRQLKMLYRRLYDEVFQLDLYSQPLSLTYQGKTNYSTTYGIVMTIITFCLILFVIVDTLVYGESSYLFDYKEPVNASTSFSIDFSKDISIFIALKKISDVK